jgi:hypothetical protein
MDVTIRSSRVADCWRHAGEDLGGSSTFAEKDKRNDVEKAIAAAAASNPDETSSDPGYAPLRLSALEFCQSVETFEID